MGLFDIITPVLKTGIGIATLPIDMIDDIASGEKRDAVISKLQKTLDGIAEIPERLID